MKKSTPLTDQVLTAHARLQKNGREVSPAMQQALSDAKASDAKTALLAEIRADAATRGAKVPISIMSEILKGGGGE